MFLRLILCRKILEFCKNAKKQRLINARKLKVFATLSLTVYRFQFSYMNSVFFISNFFISLITDFVLNLSGLPSCPSVPWSINFE